MNRRLPTLLISLCWIMTSCAQSLTAVPPVASAPVAVPALSDEAAAPKIRAPQLINHGAIRSDFAPGELTELCNAHLAVASKEVDVITTLSEDKRTIDNTLLALENAMADLNDSVIPLTFMGYVSSDEKVSAEGADCEVALGQFSVQMWTRRDLYQAIQKAQPRSPDEARLLQKTMEAFEQNGLKLSDDVLAQVRDLKAKLSTIESQYSTNLNADKTVVLFSAVELEGLPADYLADLKKDANGRLIVNTKESDYPLVMQNAVNSETRKKMMTGYLNRGGAENAKLLSEAVTLRAQIAHLMGYKTWADARIEGRMAQNSETVLGFLNGLKGKLAERNQADLQRVLKFKQETVPSATRLDQWDISYYSYQLQKRDFSLDNEKIREYFPTDLVISGMFQIYSKIFGVRYEQIADAKVWAPDVKMYAVRDANDDRLIGYFYTDFFPRAGKYSHAAAFPLISARLLQSGEYSAPVSSIVANLSPPMNGKPSLLAHDDVDTIFHEFGHIMHQTLTRARYASLSGSAVAQDFVEAPSQMLENWVWSPEILNMLSGHYLDHSQKLPADLLQKMIAAREFNQGYAYTKQLLYALFDMTLHTQDGPVDASKIYLELYREVMKAEPLENQQFPSSFGHLMGGYDAGYYGYLWSEVYAQDMFTQFSPGELTNSEVGARYRKSILEPGNMRDALDLLREFLGREPNAEAFFKKLHI